MNIIVKKYNGGIECRPDTTWERENKDFYSPDFVKSLMYTPIVFARIAKAGKCVGTKFAERYYDGTGFGVLLLPDGLSYMDHTSILPMPLFNKMTLDYPGNVFRLSCDEKEIFNTEELDGFAAKIEAAICEVSQYITLRIGDMLAVELAESKELAESYEIMGQENSKEQVEQAGEDKGGNSTLKGGKSILSGNFADNETFRFCIIR